MHFYVYGIHQKIWRSKNEKNLFGFNCFYVTVQHPVKGTLIFGQNRENKISVSSLL